MNEIDKIKLTELLNKGEAIRTKIQYSELNSDFESVEKYDNELKECLSEIDKIFNISN